MRFTPLVMIALAICLGGAVMHELPSWLPGLWTREWIERKGVRTDTLEVHYLQTPSFFADVRFPRDRPRFPGAKSLGDLSDADLRVLARQRGFTGRTTVAGDTATWLHEIDFQPPDGEEDVGRLERIDDSHLREHALDGSYVESWRKIGEPHGRYLVLRVERAGRLDRTLIVAGDRFLYVRNRKHDLPKATSLEALIASLPREQVMAALDCEFSTGPVRGWQIERSTLPWLEGRRLEFAAGLTADLQGEQLVVPVNTFSKAELRALFPTRP
jgi:hypothetical protein